MKDTKSSIRLSTLAILLAALQLLLEIIGTCGAAAESGFRILRYYTELSNLFGLLAAALYLLFALKARREGSSMPLWVRGFRYMSACCLTLTFLVVIFVLCPSGVASFRYMLFGGHMLYNHTLCPLLAVAALLTDPGEALPKRWTLLALLPTLLYGIVTVILNITGQLYGPYPFLHVYEQSLGMSLLWAVIIVGGAYGICLALRPLSGKTEG